MRLERRTLMKDFHCRDLDLNCEFVAKGDGTEEVLERTERHLKEAHRLAVTPQLEERLKWLIHDQASPMHRDSIQKNS
jgi:predicted small metal-binding protein